VTKVVLDANIFDKLANDEPARVRVSMLCGIATLAVVVPDTVRRQLLNSPFGGVPDWFPSMAIPDSVFILDHLHLDVARLGNGDTYTAHLGASGQFPDAVIVDAADNEADVFVSEDRRARRHYAKLRGQGRALNYERCCADLLSLESA
jgi:hypothetical protein